MRLAQITNVGENDCALREPFSPSSVATVLSYEVVDARTIPPQGDSSLFLEVIDEVVVVVVVGVGGVGGGADAAAIERGGDKYLTVLRSLPCVEEDDWPCCC